MLFCFNPHHTNIFGIQRLQTGVLVTNILEKWNENKTQKNTTAFIASNTNWLL